MNNKTFRLFVSSTFNDFREERKALQTIVFPEIKKYCREKGYTFQPIDLRWGINHEAQLDQKTLEICLNEVRSCKTYAHPNFLVMLGDRYGWIPLPYLIEKVEFELILQECTTKEKKELLEWYQLDNNQLPASYILKERTGEFSNDKTWGKIEQKLLKLLQAKIYDIDIEKNRKKKYFTSATEAEIIEGIIPYDYTTEHQTRIVNENPEITKIDADYIFGFIRNIDIKSKKSDVFIGADYKNAIKTKLKLKKVLPKENILEVNTTQLTETEIKREYINTFIDSAIAFLKQKIDKQITKEKEITELEREIIEQKYFAEQKRKNFIGQEEVLKSIQEYILNDNQKPLIIYGKSGSGKSSIMAKAIEQIEDKTKSQVIYRFVGATAEISNTTSLLISIFKELGIDLENNNKPQRQETFDEFSKKAKKYFYNIKQDVIIFIDAIDQIVNDDTFIWLPNVLPSNIKIIFSALKDNNYKKDSKYFKYLSQISENKIEIKAFENAKELLLSLLKNEKRTIQQHQMEYFFQQYQKVKTPLFVYIASQEIKNWQSFDDVGKKDVDKTKKNKKLANSQKGIIRDFINNLSSVYHHDKNLVNRVLGYIYASKEGLSEYEILELLNVDENFINKVSSNTFHKNFTNELPLIFWIRLYNQLKPFLSIKKQNNKELLFFFHREFIDVIHKNKENKKEHENLIENCLTLIDEPNSTFNKNRYGIIYSNALSLHITSKYLTNKNIAYVHPYLNHKWITFFNKGERQNYLIELVKWNNSKWDYYSNSNSVFIEIAYLLSFYANDKTLRFKTMRNLIIVFNKREKFIKALPIVTELNNITNQNDNSIPLIEYWYNRNVISHFYYNHLTFKFEYIYNQNLYKKLYLDNQYILIELADKLFTKNSKQYINCINNLLEIQKDKKLEEEKSYLINKNVDVYKDQNERIRIIFKLIEKSDEFDRNITLYKTLKNLIEPNDIALQKKYLYKIASFYRINSKTEFEIEARIKLDTLLDNNKQKINNLKRLLFLLNNNSTLFRKYLTIYNDYVYQNKSSNFKEYIQFINYYFYSLIKYTKLEKELIQIFDELEILYNKNKKRWYGHFLKFLNNLNLNNINIPNIDIPKLINKINKNKNE